MDTRSGRMLWYPGYEVMLRDIVRAENCSLFSSNGTRYVDLESGVWAASLGHGHPAVQEAIGRQSERIAHNGFNYSTPIVAEAGQTLLELTGMAGGGFVFLCSGSEAVEYAVRMAQMILGGRRLMILSDAYCGAYGSARERAEALWYTFDWRACRACPGERVCGDACPHWRGIPFDELGGFLLEPGSASGFARFPPRNLVEGIFRETKKRGGLFLVNEVTTGIGRTGRWFGYQHYEVSPDAVAMGKGIGNGYPVSATVVSAAMLTRLDDREVPYAQSHQNDPLGAAVVLAVIDAIRANDLIARGRRLGKRLARDLVDLQRSTGKIESVRGRGLLIALDLAASREHVFARRVHRGLVEHGYLTCLRPRSRTVRIDPSLTVEERDIDGFLHALDAVLRGIDRP